MPQNSSASPNRHLELDPKLGIEKNAARSFEAAKKLRRKLAGVRAVIGKFRQQLADLERRHGKELDALARETPAAAPAKLEWFEKFRWFRSSEGFLCIGGRDAVTNEIVVKKHTQPGDRVFHTEAPGSPFFIVKCEGRTPGEATLRETAEATVAFSRAWKLGIGSLDVYHVEPGQVSKQTESGEYLTRGAFMVRGKREWLTASPKLAVGITADGKVMAGPPDAIQKHCARHADLAPGETKPSDAAKAIQKRIGGDIDGILRALPAGGARLLRA
jgi:predicted ribosome quality control (RQC) complex YloA/Tae2 family protein